MGERAWYEYEQWACGMGQWGVKDSVDGSCDWQAAFVCTQEQTDDDIGECLNELPLYR
jgi:hypothetical protein